MEKSDDEDEQEMKHWGFLGVEPAPKNPGESFLGVEPLRWLGPDIAVESGSGSNVLPAREAQTLEPVNAGPGATMGMSPEESTAQSPVVTVASQATEVEPPPCKKKRIEVEDL